MAQEADRSWALPASKRRQRPYEPAELTPVSAYWAVTINPFFGTLRAADDAVLKTSSSVEGGTLETTGRRHDGPGRGREVHGDLEHEGAGGVGELAQNPTEA